MARINYYQFPETVDVLTRLANGAEGLGESSCAADAARYAASGNPHFNCPYRDGDFGCISCSRLTYPDTEDTISGLSVSRAKWLLAEFGGAAWTCHIERDGGVFETTAIKIGKNNSRFKYNVHL